MARASEVKKVASYQLGDIFSSQDVRLTKTIRLRERTDLRLIGEVFNIFNTSNLTSSLSL